MVALHIYCTMFDLRDHVWHYTTTSRLISPGPTSYHQFAILLSESA